MVGHRCGEGEKERRRRERKKEGEEEEEEEKKKRKKERRRRIFTRGSEPTQFTLSDLGGESDPWHGRTGCTGDS